MASISAPAVVCCADEKTIAPRSPAGEHIREPTQLEFDKTELTENEGETLKVLLIFTGTDPP